MMIYNIIVVAISTLKGKRVNWVKTMQQKMGEKLTSKSVERPTILKLYSTSNVSIYCQDLPPLAFVYGMPLSSMHTPSPKKHVEDN